MTKLENGYGKKVWLIVEIFTFSYIKCRILFPEKSYHSKHLEKPAILIDVKELNRVLGERDSPHTFANALNMSGKYFQFNEILEYFFGEIKRACANLMFILLLDEVTSEGMSKVDDSII